MNQALYLIINNRSITSMSKPLAEVYREEKDEDGFLYVVYASQQVKSHDKLHNRFINLNTFSTSFLLGVWIGVSIFVENLDLFVLLNNEKRYLFFFCI